ncbi:MAG: glycoside hydrolase family 11 protein, partial [Oscillospiraceae bacterium]|nr:glycoside hydrolase family 11 protein [Oscillospiraceae bacterium]
MLLTGSDKNGGTYTASWSGTHNVLFRSGQKFSTTSGGTIGNPTVPAKNHAEIGDISFDFDFTWNTSDGAAYVAVYGWAFYAPGSAPQNFSNQIEYYILTDRKSYNPGSAGTKQGEASINGIMYDFYVSDRIGQPMLTGNGNFKQYWSIPRTNRQQGEIDVSAHFKAWEDAGMKMDGALYEAAFKVESWANCTSGHSSANQHTNACTYPSSGTATINKNIMTITEPSDKVGDKFTVGDFDYEILTLANGANGTAAFLGKSDFARTTAIIPASVTSPRGKVYSVTEIGLSAFANKTALATVTIPDSVTSIGNFAFAKTTLTTVTLPANLKSIGAHAFDSVPVTKIVIPASVNSIGEAAFLQTNLAEVTFSGLIPPTFGSGIGSDNVFGGSTDLTTIYVPVGSKAAYSAISQLSSYDIVEYCPTNCGLSTCPVCTPPGPPTGIPTVAGFAAAAVVFIGVSAVLVVVLIKRKRLQN